MSGLHPFGFTTIVCVKERELTKWMLTELSKSKNFQIWNKYEHNIYTTDFYIWELHSQGEKSYTAFSILIGNQYFEKNA